MRYIAARGEADMPLVLRSTQLPFRIPDTTSLNDQSDADLKR